MRVGAPKTAYLILIIIILSVSLSYSKANNLNSPGRTLPDGSWQPRNNHATINSPIDNQDPFNILADWGEDVRLSYFSQPNSHDPEIAAVGDHIYVVWWFVLGDTIFMAQSSDGGNTWTSQRLSDENANQAVVPQISASGSNVYVVYRAFTNWNGVYLQRSNNYGIDWHPTQRLYYAREEHYAEDPVGASKDSMVYVVSAIDVNYIPPNQDWDLWLFRSTNCGQSWPETTVVSDTDCVGKGPDLAANNYGLHLVRGYGLISSNATEVIYNGSTDNGISWYGPTMISNNDTCESFWPQIAAWGDSNVMISWTDYKASPEEWTGDAFISKSTDNGHSWSSPTQMTFSHGVTGTDIYAKDDTVIICYDDARDGTDAIYANISYNGGETWQDDQRVSDSHYYYMEPSVAISNGTGHLSWADSRNSPTDPGLLDIYYDRNNLRTGIQERREILPPDDITLEAYPNPFNSSTSIGYDLPKASDITLAVFDILGRKVATLVDGHQAAGHHVVIWNAGENSSGIYFARASGGNNSAVIKLIYLK